MRTLMKIYAVLSVTFIIQTAEAKCYGVYLLSDNFFSNVMRELDTRDGYSYDTIKHSRRLMYDVETNNIFGRDFLLFYNYFISRTSSLGPGGLYSYRPTISVADFMKIMRDLDNQDLLCDGFVRTAYSIYDLISIVASNLKKTEAGRNAARQVDACGTRQWRGEKVICDLSDYVTYRH